MPSTKYALIDCNNFYVSCELVFNPKLKGRPVVVLSNNDGCIISRSKEAKSLGIAMGVPAFQCKEIFFRHDVVVLSSNYMLYGDMSQRVMETLEELGLPLDIYSIDEAFLEIPLEAGEKWGDELRQKVLQWTGIPISVGIGPTKTLAKAASELAKKRGSVAWDPSFLPSFPVQEVWGVGRKTAELLHEYSIRSALDLIQASDSWIQSQLGIGGLRTVMELRGTPCFAFAEAPTPRKGIVSSRSFGKEISRVEELKEAVASFISIGAEKLREQKSFALHLSVFVLDKSRQSHVASMQLAEATSYTPTLIAYASTLVEKLFHNGMVYKKAGVMLNDLSSSFQADLFTPPKKPQVMHLVDKINRKSGKKSLFFAAEGTIQRWKGAASRRTQRFTTNWDELLTVRA